MFEEYSDWMVEGGELGTLLFACAGRFYCVDLHMSAGSVCRD
jgi:hypothetical protein